MKDLRVFRRDIREAYLRDEAVSVRHLLSQCSTTDATRDKVRELAAHWVQRVRQIPINRGHVDAFLHEYDLFSADRFYPQFATHNAYTAADVLIRSSDCEKYEFQRLHGMGDALYETMTEEQEIACRVYARVGNYHELLPSTLTPLIAYRVVQLFLEAGIPAPVIQCNQP